MDRYAVNIPVGKLENITLDTMDELFDDDKWFFFSTTKDVNHYVMEFTDEADALIFKLRFEL